MAIERWELEQRRRGNTHAADLARNLRAQYGDVSLHTTEALPEIQRFTPEAKQALEERDYRIYSLTGQSIKTLRVAGKPIRSSCQRYAHTETIQSRFSEVAVNPQKLFLPFSGGRTFMEQLSLVRNFSRALDIYDVQAVIGEVPDYAELTFKHLEATGESLFGLSNRYNNTRTITPTGIHSVANIGAFHAKRGLNVTYCLKNETFIFLRIAPLIFPTK